MRVIELRSASDTLSSLKTKMQEYIENGVSLGWLIDRQNRTAFICILAPETFAGFLNIF
jgi:Uma2 family endonuclease